MRNWKPFLLSMIWGPLLLAQILLIFAFDYYYRAGIDAMMYAGWVIWLITAVGVVVIVLLYMDILKADRYEIEKFGDEYRQYMKEVPRINFLLGTIRLLKRKK